MSQQEAACKAQASETTPLISGRSVAPAGPPAVSNDEESPGSSVVPAEHPALPARVVASIIGSLLIGLFVSNADGTIVRM